MTRSSARLDFRLRGNLLSFFDRVYGCWPVVNPPAYRLNLQSAHLPEPLIFEHHTFLPHSLVKI